MFVFLILFTILVNNIYSKPNSDQEFMPSNCHSNELPYPINSPYSKLSAKQNILFSNFHEQPKHLDPARSYSSDESLFISQIYEPPYEYHYLLRPYKLIPLMAEDYITVEYFDSNNKKLPNNVKASEVKFTVYTVKIRENILYQPHAAFARDQNNNYIYHNLDRKFIKTLYSINQFNLNKKNISYTRELEANDFIYGMKRLADPKVQSPIYSFMANHINQLDTLNKLIGADNDKRKSYLNLNDYNIDGFKLIDKYTYQVKIKGRYPQFKYWFAMSFFAPVPWEADKFYSQSGLKEQNISLDTYPVGTGAYMLTVNNPNQKIVLVKNPNYNHGVYPSEGMPNDNNLGLLEYAGMPLPFINKGVFLLEKESIPIWNKFIQGYYDANGISSDNFDQAITMNNNQAELSQEMQDKNIKLIKSIEPSIFYWGFNMLDPVIGGYDEKKIKLRRAIAIAFDVEEYINIFMNGRGKVAHGPIPPGILPLDDINTYLYQSSYKKKSLDTAKQLLSEAGYPNGVDPKTGQQLVINFDASSTGNSNENSLFNWLREQLKKINIELNVRVTQYNKFQEKIREGQEQMFFWGWNADYPDPENFLFLFSCDQAKVKKNGENTTNYCSKEYEDLFKKFQEEDDKIRKITIIKQMIKVLQKDSPWIFGFYNELYILQHSWNSMSKPLGFANNTLKYKSINSNLRVKKQILWNQPIFWPLFMFVILMIIILLPVIVIYYNKNHKPLAKI